MTHDVYKNSKFLIDGFVNTVVRSVINNIINDIIENNTVNETENDESSNGSKDKPIREEEEEETSNSEEEETSNSEEEETSNSEEEETSSGEEETSSGEEETSSGEEETSSGEEETSSGEEEETSLPDIETFTTFNFVIEDSLIEYINNLDVYILSPGGVGSNHITDFLLSHNFNVRPDLLKCQDTCHYPYKLIPDKKTIYLYGDVKNAVISQYKRELLHYNATKLQLKRDYDHKPLEYFIETFPDDPLGIRKQYNNIKNTPNTAMVQYPYTADSMKEAFDKLDITVDMSDFIVKERMNYNITVEYYVKHPVLKQLLDIYEDIVFE